ncbi:MAG TPA: DNA polymerase III subunit beta [Nitrospinota bacterium]|jgi:DNA polymerase-3 subunit beta|nr:DNA polymerase III subunit beta [Nitrospinota bacterium]|tara:strand:+ start:63043 stop:64143 length:1101 start_codon:yes stop_codon:yes gene_type:complete
MEFIIGRDELLKAVQRAQGVVAAKGPMPILANVLIEAEDDGIKMFATNLDIGLKGTYKANVSSKGQVSVQAKKLHDIVKELPPDDVFVKLDDDGRCRLNCGKSRFNLATINTDDFPSFPRFDESKFVNLDRNMIGEMIRKTSYAISQDETRLTLNGASLEVSKSSVRMVATDGHRLAFIEREGVVGIDTPCKMIVVKKAINELSKLISESEGPLRFVQHDNHLILDIDSLYMSVRLIEGAYPNYEQVIPKGSESTAVISTAELVQGLRRVVTLADEKSHMIRFSFTSGKLEMVSEGGDVGEARDEVPIDFDGADITIGLNGNYVIDLLGIINNEKVEIRMKDQLSPVVAKSPDDEGLLCLVMPMRL